MAAERHRADLARHIALWREVLFAVFQEAPPRPSSVFSDGLRVKRMIGSCWNFDTRNAMPACLVILLREKALAGHGKVRKFP